MFQKSDFVSFFDLSTVRFAFSRASSRTFILAVASPNPKQGHIRLHFWCANNRKTYNRKNERNSGILWYLLLVVSDLMGTSNVFVILFLIEIFLLVRH